MNVSKSELTALLKQAFEGLNFACGEHENAAQMVVWAEMTGLGGLQELRTHLPQLIKRQCPPLQCVSEDQTHAVLDAGNGSALSCADVAVNMAYVKALKHGFSSVTVVNCHARKFLIRALKDCGDHGMACLMHWRNAHDSTVEHLVSVTPTTGTDCLPRFSLNKVSAQRNANAAQQHSVVIRCDTQRQRSEEYLSSVFPKGREELAVIEPEDLLINYHSAQNQGLTIDKALWNRLQKLALNVLVETSEQSRMGAGD